MSATQTFLPWVRQGAASSIHEEDRLDDRLSAHATLPIGLHVDGAAQPVNVSLRLYGPGDVVGIDARQVVRTVPAPGTPDFPATLFPAIEFDRPDYPWLFSPARADTQGRLRPWLTLVVVRQQSGVTLGSRGGPLPVLEIKAPAVVSGELPDVSEAWAWAHAQVLHDGNGVEALLSTSSTRTVSRLLCPRRLEPRTQYHACLVPSFDVGRKAGLGLPLTAGDEGALRPAWSPGADAPFEIQLPVYYHWTFRTDEGDDFESAVRLLQPLRELPAAMGGSQLYVGDGGVTGMKDLATIPLAGVFRPTAVVPPILPATNEMSEAQKAWVEQLSVWLNHADDAARGSTQEAIVTLPLYGGYQQALQRVPTKTGWMRDLNLDPRNRAAAGLGVLFVQWHQEELMAAAWDQLGEIRQAQQIVRQAQFAQEVRNVIYARRIVPMKGRGEMLYQSTSPLHARVEISSEQTVAGWATSQQRALPATLAAFRRLARPNGPVLRRLSGTSARPTVPVAVRQVQTGTANPQATQPHVATNAVRVSDLKKCKSAWSASANNDSRAQTRAFVAVDKLMEVLERLAGVVSPPPPALSAFDAARQDTLLEALRPEVTAARYLESRISIDGLGIADVGVSSDALERGVLGYPEFPLPMYEAVRELMPDLLLTGADDLPDNSVSMLETNPQFIEAFMVGANHEMARELLWRGFPTDLRGSYFGHFWGATGDANQARPADVPPLHEWIAGTRLGGNLQDGHVQGQLVLVFKGDLLRRFPNTVIYAVEATASGLGTLEKHPIHRGVAGENAVFLIFDLTEKQARGGPGPAGDGGAGWFFVLQEQATEARFGLDSIAAVTPPATWSDVAWDHVDVSSGGYLGISASAAKLSTVTQPAGLKWGFNAAHMAEIALQRPFRIAVHARRLL